MSTPLRLALPLLMLLLGACQTTPQRDFATERVEGLDRWTIDGRLGYRSGDEGGSASVHWVQQSRDQGRIHFSGPIGIGSARLSWSPGAATLEQGNDRFEARSPGLLAWRLTGLILPVQQLHYWVRGLAAPTPKATGRKRVDGQLRHLRQAGWELTFERYEEVAGLTLPHRIKAERDDQRFTLLVQSWQPAP
jgi:outer membrane lipoprotein LolB